MNPLTYVIINLAIVALLYVGSIEINIGGMASGDVIALVNYMNQILVELVKLANLIVQVSKALACAGRVQAVLDTKPGMEFPAQLTGNVPAEKADDAVRFDHVSLTYKGAGAPSLSDINFTAKRGQTIGVIGGTGSGKSSLISLIPRFYDATEGSVEIMGRPVRQYPRADLRGKVAVVMQKAQLFGGTIRSNLLWGSQNASDADLWAALETAQAAEFVKAKPLGLDEPVEQGGRNLSGGQKQRLTIARALVGKPDILILDDSATIADALDARANEIAEANAIDMQKSAEHGMDAGKLDRLKFDVPRVNAAAQGVRHVATLQDPIGEIVRGYHLDNGLRLEQTRVPIGVLGMIYEARPNVTVDVASLCIKSGNAALLRGGHAAERTNAATLNIIADVLHEHGYDAALIASVDEYGRQGANAMMQAQGHIDLLIPRGGAGLIQAVVQNSKVPVIETGAGNVHIYVDRTGDQNKAIPIILNAKTQRVGVCNATEKLLVHSDIAEAFLPQIATALAAADVEVHADEQAYEIIDKTGIDGVKLIHATEEDWDTEYLALKIGVKVVDSLDEAISHINRHSTGHTESIIAEDYSAIEEFTSRIDSAVVMVNASTRFTDGGVFGFGAELGISTQKMHARGPMGLREMTTTKWIGYGTGQVRA